MRKETGIQPRPVESEVWVRATVYVIARVGQHRQRGGSQKDEHGDQAPMEMMLESRVIF